LALTRRCWLWRSGALALGASVRGAGGAPNNASKKFIALAGALMETNAPAIKITLFFEKPRMLHLNPRWG
jgi:hypothetical protein